MLLVVVDHAGAVVATPKHWMSPLLKAMTPHNFVSHKKEIIGSGYDAYVHFRGFGKAAK